MPPRSPLPNRDGLQAAWVRTFDRGIAHPWSTMGAFLRERLADNAPVTEMLASGRFVDDHGVLLTGEEPYRPNTFIWFHRDRPDEPEVPFPVGLLHVDDRIVVVDKPPFLSTIPRGRHVTQSVVVRVRTELGLPEASPVHRLDRLTSGVLVLTTRREWRGTYQRIFEDKAVTKTYEALAPLRDDLHFPLLVSNHIIKERGSWQARILTDREPNAETTIELMETHHGIGRYQLTPHTGKTHQLRVHMNAVGIPILGDPLYPEVLDVAVDDFSTRLALLATRLSFQDPIDDEERVFTTRQRLPWPEKS